MRPNLEKENQSYRSSIENIKDYAIFMLDKNGNILTWGTGAEQLFGYTAKETIGQDFSILFTESSLRQALPDSSMKTALQKKKCIFQEQFLRKNNRKFWSNGVLTTITDKLSRHQGFSMIVQDATASRRTQNTRLHQSMHDFLTGLPNRRALEETLANALRDKGKKGLLAVFYLDFDNFKMANDFGHEHGDRVLIAIADRLKKHTRRKDVVARIGGDEFIILLQGVRKPEDIFSVAEKTLKLFQRVITVDKKSILTTASIGIAVHPKDGLAANELLHHADIALYQAKKIGGNSYKTYNDEFIKNKL